MCHMQVLNLNESNISDPGLTALAKAVESGALDHLTVCWRPTALFPCLETWHVHSPDSEHLLVVPYAGAFSQRQPDREHRPHRFRKGGGERGAGQVDGTLVPHCLVPMP